MRSLRTGRRSGRCTTTRSCSTASRSRWSLPKRRRSRATRRRWSGWNTREAARHGHLSPARRGRPGQGSDKSDRGVVRAAEGARHARAGARCGRRAPRGRIFRSDRASQPDGALCLDGGLRGRRQAHGLRQDPGRAERAEVSLRRVRHEAGGRARHVALHGRRIRLRPAPAVSGGARGARGARAAALGARRADAPADVRAGLPAGDDPAHRDRCKHRRNARCDHARRGHRDLAIRGLPSAGDGLVRSALQIRQCEIRAQARAARSCDLVRYARAQRRHRALCARIRDGRARRRAQARPARASPAVLFGSRPARERAVQQQGAARMLPRRARRRSAGTSAIPSRARCATAASWSAGAWRRASGRRCRCRSRCASCSPPTAMPRWRAQPPTSAPAPTPSWRRSRPTCSGCRSTTSASSLANSSLPQSPVEGGSWIATSVSNGIVTTAGAIRDELLRLAKQMPNSPLANAAPDEVDARGRQAGEQARRFARGVDRRCHAAGRRGPHRAGENDQPRP